MTHEFLFICQQDSLPVIVIQANLHHLQQSHPWFLGFPSWEKFHNPLWLASHVHQAVFAPINIIIYICCNSCYFFNNIGTSTKYNLVSTAKLLWSIDTLFFYFFASKSKYLYLFQSK